MIILLYGPDTYRSRQRLYFYRDGFKKKYDSSGLNVIHLDGEKLAMEELRKNVGQVGFLAKKRFVIVDNLIHKNKNKKIQEEIVEYLDKEMFSDNVLIFYEETGEEKRTKKKTQTKTRGVTTLMARLKKEKAEYFPLLNGVNLNKWIREQIKKKGGQIADPAVLELASLVGSDLWNMNSEIEKLIHLKNGKVIGPDDVRSFVRAAFDENIFHLTDALASKDAKMSYRLINERISSGSHELYILTMLIRQFRILLQTGEIIDKEPNYYTVATRLRVHPFVAQKAIRDARKFTLAELKNIYRQLLEIDIRLKSTQDDPRLLFDLLITRVCRV